MVTKVCSHHYVCSSICFYTGIKRQDTAKANSAFLLKDHRPKVGWKQLNEDIMHHCGYCLHWWSRAPFSFPLDPQQNVL